MYEHMVLFRFASEPSKDQLNTLYAMARQFPEHIPGIVDVAIGRDTTGRNQGFQVGLTVRFVDRAALDAYGPHPKHQELVQYSLEMGRTDIIVVDFPIES
ncbi:hypothetical protein Alches_07280 [Alicyclobacillus hesperidum subsp. aegles]|uniref:Dabb family protein n=1 Tax=Alicyclobacillus hesperidum TaxID=89784 RepID=UPI00222D9AB6|nr:Dabb family protein [Alicyclobacillus hesperidum]GLG00689.1 hypothetical protein Alches_07280 [Alicyclobacillus hesperidum subsp. aegles]